MHSQRLRERFARLDWRQQMGNLASTFARISARAADPEYADLVRDLLREASLFVEWIAPQAPKACLLELAAMQRETLAWRRLWPLHEARSLLALYSRHRSDWLLHTAGFIG